MIPPKKVASAPVAAVLLLALFTPGIARATNNDGMEIGVRPAVALAGSGSPVVYKSNGAVFAGTPPPVFGGSESPYGAGFNGDAYLGWRVIKYFSFGLRGGFRSSGASGAAEDSLARSAFDVGLYARVYVPISSFEIFGGLAPQYMQDKQTWNDKVTGFPGVFTLTHHGVALPLEVGAAYRFLDVLAVGPSLSYAQVFPAGGCAAFQPNSPNVTTVSFCSGSPPTITGTNGYGVLTAGLDLRATLF